jgi:hypothetical protein
VSGSFPDTELGCDMRRRTLRKIAAFSRQRAERWTFERALKKQRDADEIKRWEQELNLVYERFSVIRTPAMSYVHELMLIPDACSIGHRHLRR